MIFNVKKYLASSDFAIAGARVPVLRRLCHIVLFFAFWALLHVLFFAGDAGAEPVGWESGRRLPTGSFAPDSYHVAHNAGLLVVVFESHSESTRGIFASVSYDGGNSFFAPVRISESGQHDALAHPRAAIGGDGRILVSWQQLNRDDLKYRIHYSFSSDKGGSFSAAETLASGSDMDIMAQPFFSGSYPFLLYHSYVGGRFSIVSSRYEDSKFSEALPLNSGDIDLRGAFFPTIALADGKILIVWQGKRNNQYLTDDLYFSSSPDAGKSWSLPLALTTTDADESSPVLLASGSELYCVYQSNEGGNWKIRLSRSLDGGMVWTQGETVFTTNTNCFLPSLQRFGGGIHLFWLDSRDKNSRVSTAVFDLQTLSFSPPQFMSKEGAEAALPISFRVGERIFCSWIEGGSIQFARNDISVSVPLVQSPTHPEGTWSNFSTAELHWKAQPDDSGIAGYATIVNKERFFNPTVQNREAHETYERIPLLPDGISYFHIRSIDKAGNYSRTFHYPLMVSAGLLETPQINSDTHKDGKASLNPNAAFSWTISGTDRLKGYHYTLSKDKVLTPEKYTENLSVSFSNLSRGRYFFSVRAVDKAGKPGRIGTFELLVGEEGSFQNIDYEKVARSISDEDTKSLQRGRSGELAALLGEKVDVAGIARGVLSINTDYDGSVLRLDFGLSGENVSLKKIIYSIAELGISEENTSQTRVELANLAPGEYTISARALYEDSRTALEYESDIVLTHAVINAKNFRGGFFTVFEGMYLRRFKLISSLIFSFCAAFLSMPLLTRIYFMFRSLINTLSARTKLFF